MRRIACLFVCVFNEFNFFIVRLFWCSRQKCFNLKICSIFWQIKVRRSLIEANSYCYYCLHLTRLCHAIPLNFSYIILRFSRFLLTMKFDRKRFSWHFINGKSNVICAQASKSKTNFNRLRSCTFLIDSMQRKRLLYCPDVLCVCATKYNINWILCFHFLYCLLLCFFMWLTFLARRK